MNETPGSAYMCRLKCVCKADLRLKQLAFQVGEDRKNQGNFQDLNDELQI